MEIGRNEKIIDLEEASSLVKQYNIEKIHKYLDFLFTKCAPFQVGDKVELIKAPIIDDDNRPGWRSYKNMLVVGATATVETVDVNCNKFIALVKFDNQFWTHYDYKLKMGIDTPLQEDVLFTFSEDYLKVICNYNHSDGI